MMFTRKDDTTSVEEFIQYCKKKYQGQWRIFLFLFLQDGSYIWWHSLNNDKVNELSDKLFEKLFLARRSSTSIMDKASHKDARKKNNEIHQGFLSSDQSIL